MRIMVLLFMMSFNLFAQEYSQTKVKIDVLGSHTGQVFYLTLKEPFKTDCAWGGIYCSVSDVNCKNYYSILLAAKMADKELLEIRYTQDSAVKSCHVSLVAVQ